jgi:hypothetical protein
MSGGTIAHRPRGRSVVLVGGRRPQHFPLCDFLLGGDGNLCRSLYTCHAPTRQLHGAKA